MTMKYEIGALILRLTLGIIFLAHGVVKFQSGIGNIAGWFESIGLSGVMAYGVASLEVVGGIALIIGLGTRIVSTLFALLLVGATVKVKLAAGLIDGYAYDLALLAMSAHLLINGSGLLSVDKILSKDRKEKTNTSKAA